MPTFPKYRGELPQCLNPLNPRHYWLLAYWVYFRPTALYCYLYRAAPFCYPLRGLSKVRRTWRIPAYRNLYLMVPLAVLLFGLMIGLAVKLYLLWTLQSHTSSVNAVAVTPDGQRAVSGSVDNTLRVWNLETGEMQYTLSGHSNSVNTVAVTPDGQRAVSGSVDNTLRVWNLETGEMQYTLSGHSNSVNAVAVTPDGQRAVSASLDNTLKVWDLQRGKLQYTLSGHSNSVNAVAVTPDGQRAVSASLDNTLKVWDLQRGKLQYTLSGHSNLVNAVAVTPDRQRAVSALSDNTLRIWDLQKGKLQYTLSGHTSSVNAVAVTPDGQRAVSASSDNTLRIWDLQRGKLQYTLSGHTSSVHAIAVTPDGQRAVSASSDNTLRIWDLEREAALPLWWAKAKLNLVTLVFCGFAVIAFAIALTLSTITFGVLGCLFCSLVCSLVFGMVFSAVASQVFHIVTTGSEFNTLGFPRFDPFGKDVFIILLSWGIAFGMTFSIALSSISRTAFGALGSMIAIMLIGVVVGVNKFELLVRLPIFFLLIQFGTLRILFYPVQVGLALYNRLRSQTHPVEWDELAILPLPGIQRLISQRLRRNEMAGLELVSQVACNPFQRSAAQQALQAYLHSQENPLHLLYKLLTHHNLNTYVFAPISKQDWERLPTMGQLILGELGGQWVNYSVDWVNQFSERLVYGLTWFRRNRRSTPLTCFAGMLYQLLDKKTVEVRDFKLSSYRNIYLRLSEYPSGIEIGHSFEAMASFLSYNELSALPTAVDAVIGLPPEEGAIRPTVLKALNRLRDIASDVATSLAATSRVNKLAALARATDALKTLDEYVAEYVLAPEQTILQRIIRQWRDLIIEEGGEVGRDELLEPVANPYVVGNPVTGDLFIGREDILLRLEELWMVKGQCPSVVIYGHRRMGKSSILRNLGASLGSQTTVVDFNMQRVGLVDSTGELLYNFALSIYDALPVTLQDQLGEPDEERFISHNPYTALDRFLKQLDPVRAEQRFIITIDEFELIEQLIEQQRLEPRLLDFWRGLIQTYPWFVLAFAGLHTLQEMTQNYWNPLFGSVTAIPVSFLPPKAAERLITQPSPDFNLDYDTEAIAEIIQLTNGQPYLMQLVGHTLVTRFNRQMFEEGIERERRFTLADVQAVINTPEFYRDGNAYFNGVWVQAENSEPAGQTAILEALSQASLSLTEIAQKTALSIEQVQPALETLQRHDVIKQQDGQYFYTVELMRRWVAQRRRES